MLSEKSQEYSYTSMRNMVNLCDTPSPERLMHSARSMLRSLSPGAWHRLASWQLTPMEGATAAAASTHHPPAPSLTTPNLLASQHLYPPSPPPTVRRVACARSAAGHHTFPLPSLVFARAVTLSALALLLSRLRAGPHQSSQHLAPSAHLHFHVTGPAPRLLPLPCASF
ncbi:hypothetical protein M011DRAFT_131516 [Sporormia fimetaria CBS 119925]|uniref:Uncharacterized protein n=1 Tax=Sporormia fimetaria CBS 119925 TaxID=1340428 RepID=A0A6A6V7I0_9PLEO|nr:hypothetical protein M011DRAFT_131516 [Sporormia fimetaria CBS 119925]